MLIEIYTDSCFTLRAQVKFYIFFYCSNLDIERRVWIRVTRRLDYLFNIWQVTKLKICSIA